MTKVINIASLRKPAAVVIETEDGKKHEMVPATVDTFLENLKDVETLGLDASPIQEAELTIRAIQRAFPTIDRKEIGGWDLDVIKSLYEMIITVNGEVVSQDPEAIKEIEQTGKSAQAA
ncbi:hypothetical protein [Rhizobium laguerreae]|jgi:hypothetical protein|uniref:hypothetical protein n=1 Tax=Rhizobium laguerreae TaxID=1076926 RepID=UPI001C917A97|nr:hypothetical protein [Rhizobium laguerreae]MBY3231880.1 hypothetical protein [Rhizobium laguerreae]